MDTAVADNGIHAPVGLKAHHAVRTWSQGRRQRFAVIVNGRRAPEPPGSDDALVDHSLFLLACFSSQRELAIARRCDGVAMLSIGWMASAVAHDPGALLAFDIAVDARHPGADLVREQPLTESQNVIG